MKSLIIFVVVIIAFAQSASANEGQTLTQQIEDLKKQAIELNRDLFILEEDLLYPAETQIALYVSTDVSHLFTLDAVKLYLNDELATHYLYTEKQINALAKGGVQRLYQGNVKQGEHELTAFVFGKGPSGRMIKRAATLMFNKDDEAKAIELVISGDKSKEQPKFELREIE